MKHELRPADPSALLEHLDFARRLARGLVRDVQLAEDLVQDTLTVALEHPPREEVRSTRAFLATVMRRLRARELRGGQRRRRREAVVAEEREGAHAPSSLELAEAMELHRRVVGELMALPEAQRDGLLLRFFEDLSAREIARRLDVPLETVRTRIQRGLVRLRARLDEREGKDWALVIAPLLREPGAPSTSTSRTWRVLRRIGAAAAAFLGLAFVVDAGRSLVGADLGYAVAPVEDEASEGEGPSGLSGSGGSRRIGLAPGIPGLLGRVPGASSEEERIEPAEQALDADRLGEILRGTFDELEALDALEGDSRESVQRATGAPSGRIDSVRLHRAQRIQRGRRTEVHVARVPLGPQLEGSAAWIALDADGGFVDGAVVGADGVVASEWAHFMKGLRHAELPELASARPRSELVERRARLEAAPATGEGALDEEQRLTLAFLRLLERMNEQASVFNLPREGRTRTLAEEFAMMEREYQATAGLAEDLRPVLGSGTETFVRLANESAAAAAEAVELLEEDPRADVRPLRRRIMQGCRDCHMLTEHAGEGLLRDLSIQKRTELGIGEGYLQVGHDLRLRHPDRERAQEVADALRLGVLALEAIR